MSNSTTPTSLTVSAVARLPGRGIAVFFEGDPPLTLHLGHYHVRLAVPGGDPLETIARVEAVRKVPPGEVMALLFPSFQPEDIPSGSKVTILRPT
jgi:hypothetical protein